MREWLPTMAARLRAGRGRRGAVRPGGAAVGLAESPALRGHHRRRPPPHLARRPARPRGRGSRRRPRTPPRSSGRGWCSCGGAPATTRRRRRPRRTRSLDGARPADRDAAARGRAGGRAQRRARDVRAARRGRGAPRTTAPDPGERAGRRRASPSSATAAGRSICSTSGAGWRPTSPSPTCAGSPTTNAAGWSRRACRPPTPRAATCRWGGGSRRSPRCSTPGVHRRAGHERRRQQRRRAPARRRAAGDAGRAAGRPAGVRAGRSWAGDGRAARPGSGAPISASSTPGARPTWRAGTSPGSPTRACTTASPACCGRTRAGDRSTSSSGAGSWSGTASSPGRSHVHHQQYREVVADLAPAVRRRPVVGERAARFERGQR